MLLSRIVILEGMTGALAPFSSLVLNNKAFSVNGMAKRF